MRKGLITPIAAASILVFMTGCAQTSDPMGRTSSAKPSVVASSTPAVPSGDGSNTPRATSSSTPTPSPSVTPTAQTVMQQGTISPQVRELQARLRQLQLFPYYDLTDTYGPVTTQAVSGFQEKNGLEANGTLDDKTWSALQQQTKAPEQAELDNQVAGPVVLNTGSADDVKDLQFRLQQVVGYTAGPTGKWDDATAQGVKAFQTKQAIPVNGQVDQRTIDRLYANTRAASPWELNGQPAPGASDGQAQMLDERCKNGRVICASMEQRKVSWVVEGKTMITMDARYGAPNFPTRPGVFNVYYKDANLISRLYGDVPMPFSICFDESRCVHYSQDFISLGWGNDGSVGSHGCVNTRDYDTMKWLFSQVRLGDTVVVY